jgi:enoyl-CoA hydratase/carnithine racemase
MAQEALLEKSGDGIAVLTLNRPQALNAIDRAMVRQLRGAIRTVEDDPEIGVLLITGAGPKSFCVGVDLKERQTWSDDEAQIFRLGELFPMYSEFEQMAKPSIAIVDGHCLGGGFEIALTCDMIVATPQSKFGLPEAKWGLIPSAGGSRKLPRLIGMARSKEMILTGQPISAAQAEQYGLINRVAPAEEALQHALGLARKVLQNVQVAVRAAKRSMDHSMDLQRTTVFDIQLANACYADKERKQAIDAFSERKAT